MSNNFYKLFEKIKNIKEQEEMDNPSNAGMKPNLRGIGSNSMDDKSMNFPSNDNGSGELEDDSDESSDDLDNLSLPEGSIDIEKITMSLNKIKKMIPKFKSMDKDKGDQLDDLLKQTSNLISSFSPEGEEEETEDGEEDKSSDLDNLMGDKSPSFGDNQGPSIKQDSGMNQDSSKDASAELPAVNPPDQSQQ
jgi:hypothetical protein